MRKAPSAVLLSVLVPLATALPVVSLPAPAPRPVTPEVRAEPLRGVDRALLGTPSAQRSLRAASAEMSTPGRPEVLVSRSGVAEFDLLGVTWRRTSGDRALRRTRQDRATVTDGAKDAGGDVVTDAPVCLRIGRPGAPLDPVQTPCPAGFAKT